MKTLWEAKQVDVDCAAKSSEAWKAFYDRDRFIVLCLIVKVLLLTIVSMIHQDDITHRLKHYMKISDKDEYDPPPFTVFALILASVAVIKVLQLVMFLFRKLHDGSGTRSRWLISVPTAVCTLLLLIVSEQHALDTHHKVKLYLHHAFDVFQLFI